MTRQPRIRLSALSKSTKQEVKVFQDNLDNKPKFMPDQPVFMRSFRKGAKWVSGRIAGTFHLPKLTFFGHDLSRQGVAPSSEKVAAILKASPPQDASQVRSFVQFVQYSAKFLPNFAQEAEPLRSLLRKNEPFIWGETQEKSFKKLEQLVAQATSFAYFRGDCNTRIIANAGPQGLGAELTQFQDSEWRAISYASRNLTEVERRYSQTKEEALALVWACERFNIYVYRRKFELETDHKPLECIFGKLSKPSARIERWVLRLQGYDYSVVYRPGKANIADSLSRLNQYEPKDSSGEEFDFVKAVAEEKFTCCSDRETSRIGF
ncbi:Retrovirus-related Pol polyprotein [Stylophora pistillata]|uniref:Retrovirus-related Pol polyprotein n=1 Tax=Stylophora pistillata TaxID=50429 RepID=A0A2B4RZ24_STYPI|nr:Retrovirus-related Pol polyprotein [Stylophora pistillata]